MSVFTKIIDGEIPGNFVWADERCVVFTTIEPCSPGHVLVVPREEVDNFIDADPALVSHLFEVAQLVGRSGAKAFAKARAGIIVAGFDVPHLHIHVIPADSMDQMDMRAATMGDMQQIQAAALRLREQLVADGQGSHVPVAVDSPQLLG